MLFLHIIGIILIYLFGAFDYSNPDSVFMGYDPGAYYLVEMMASILGIGIPIIFMFKHIKKTNSANLLPFKKLDLKFGIALSVFGIFARATVKMSGCWIPVIFNTDYPEPAYETSTLIIILMIIRASIIPAIFEELMFRGVILSSLRKYGDMFAILISSVLFALFHGNLAQMVSTFIGGLAYGFIAVKSNSLIIPMIVHFTNNFWSDLVIIISEETTDYIADLFFLGSSIIVLICGVIAIKYLLKNHRDIFEFNDNPTLLSFKQRLNIIVSSPAIIIFFVLAILFAVINY